MKLRIYNMNKSSFDNTNKCKVFIEALNRLLSYEGGSTAYCINLSKDVYFLLMTAFIHAKNGMSCLSSQSSSTWVRIASLSPTISFNVSFCTTPVIILSLSKNFCASIEALEAGNALL